MNYAIKKMLFETCGEDPEMIANAKVTKIAPNTYHIQYSNTEFDPYNEIDLKVQVTELPYNGYQDDRYAYNIFESVYGETGKFVLDAGPIKDCHGNTVNI